MYISRIQLTDAISQGSQLGKLLIEKQYGMHRLLWDLFSSDGPGRHFLFREEHSREQLSTEHNRPLYYVLSSVMPAKDSPLFQVETKQFEPKLKIGDRLSFKLRANPVVAKKTEGSTKSQKHDVVMNAQLEWLKSTCKEKGLKPPLTKKDLKIALLKHPDFSGIDGAKKISKSIKVAGNEAAILWLEQRSEGNGFKLEALQCSGYRWNPIPEKSTRDRRVGFRSMDYAGVLSVTNRDLFLPLLSRGIGSAKAFGCGLLLIRRDE